MQTYKVTVDQEKTICWYNEKNQFHRLDGPAIEWANGDKSWYDKDKLHRLDGPAVECADGYKAWWVNGNPHRLDGPAIEYANGRKVWYVNGKLMTEEKFKAYIKPTCEGKVIEVDGIKYKLVKA